MDLPRGGYHGLRIEMKKYCKSATASELQHDWLVRLANEGYKTALCRGHAAAISVMCDYLGLQKPARYAVMEDWAIVTYNQ